MLRLPTLETRGPFRITSCTHSAARPAETAGGRSSARAKTSGTSTARLCWRWRIWMIRRRTNSRGRRAHVAQFFDSLGCGNTGFLLFCPVVLSGMPRGHKSTIDLERNISINFRNNIADIIHFQNQLLVFASLLVSRATYSRRPRFVVRLVCSFPWCSGGA